MSTDQNSVLRIFLSSTAIDMVEHRKKVSEAIQRLDMLPVSMEHFGAMPNEPMEVCKTKVLQSDALVVMVSHRYGCVPTTQEGGNEKKSITWIEVETAIGNDIPVFAFIVDEEFGWTQPKEQDLLTKMTDANEIAKIVKNVQSLNEFKTFLNSKTGLTIDKFTIPDDLAMKVATSLSTWRLTNEITKIQNKLKKPSTELNAFKKELAQIISNEFIKIKGKPNSKTISAREMLDYYSSLADAIIKKLAQE